MAASNKNSMGNTCLYRVKFNFHLTIPSGNAVCGHAHVCGVAASYKNPTRNTHLHVVQDHAGDTCTLIFMEKFILCLMQIPSGNAMQRLMCTKLCMTRHDLPHGRFCIRNTAMTERDHASSTLTCEGMHSHPSAPSQVRVMWYIITHH